MANRASFEIETPQLISFSINFGENIREDYCFERNDQSPYRPTRGRTYTAASAGRARRGIKSEIQGLAFMELDRAPALRSGTADERRFLAAAWLHEPRRLRGRLPPHASGKRHPVAPADHARCERRLRQETDAGQQQDRTARSRRGDARRAQR